MERDKRTLITKRWAAIKSQSVCSWFATIVLLISTLPPDYNFNNQQNSTVAAWDVTLTPTAISLTSFTAARLGNAVVVRWTTSAEINTWGFHLYRSVDGRRASAVRITPQLIIGKGRGQGGASYSWTDAAATPGTTYSYWLQEIELSGATDEYGPASALSQSAPMSYYIFVPAIVQ